MKKLDNKGYLLVEIIVGIVLALGIAYFLMNLTIKFSRTEEDIYQSISWINDKNILTNMIMEDIEKYNLVSVNKSGDEDTKVIVNFKFSDSSIGDNGVKKLIIDKENNKIIYGYEGDEYTKNIDKTLSVGNICIGIGRDCDNNVEESDSDSDYTMIKIPVTSLYSDEDYGIKLFIPYGIKYLYDIVASESVMDNVSSEFVTASTGINFGDISSDHNGKGVYTLSSSVDEDYPIYYYRGAVEDNNVIFADFCWKIVRTTETGGIKLIYNGVPTDGICNNTGESSQLSSKKFNSNPSSIAKVGYMYGAVYEKLSKEMDVITDTYYYGSDVSYDNGTYTLTGNVISNSKWSNIYNGGLNNNHYTCLSSEITCDDVYYIYYSIIDTAYYITLKNGKKIGDALIEMLDYNTTSNIVKGDETTEGTLDYWYYTNIYSTVYNDYVEDTVWCNDRTIYQLSGWNPNGGDITKSMVFEARQRLADNKPSLSCTRKIDSFTVSDDNGNGNLNYPVGLLTVDEIMLAGNSDTGNSTFYLYTGKDWWLSSPSSVAWGLAYQYLGESLSAHMLEDENGVRPSISLRHDVVVESGKGTVDNPYVIK